MKLNEIAENMQVQFCIPVWEQETDLRMVVIGIIKRIKKKGERSCICNE